MKKPGFIYDMERCIGCRACQLACKEASHLPAGVYFRRVEEGADIHGNRFFYSGACNHCKDPACVAVCPVGAMVMDESGLVLHLDALCMGCERCVFACPYGEVVIHPQTGFAAKCDGCAARLREGREPVCVGACPTSALRLEDPEEAAAKETDPAILTYGGPSVLPDPALTLPSLMVKHVPEGICREGSFAWAQYRSFAGNGTGRTFEAKAADAGEAADHEENAGRPYSDSDLLVIGGGIAGAMAAAAAAEHCEGVRILFCGDENESAYCRPLLSKGMLQGFTADRYQAPIRDLLQNNNISYIGKKKAIRLDTAAKRAYFEDGSEISYDACILATGAGAFMPPIPGTGECNVLTVRQMQDTQRLRKMTLKSRSAVVIGGGFIGLEMAWQLKELGLRVTVLEGMKKLLGRLVDQSTSDILKEQLKAQGLEVHTDVRIQRFCRTDGTDSVSHGDRRDTVSLKMERDAGSPANDINPVSSGDGQYLVLLEDGRCFAADLILLSTGVRANIQLALDSGIAADRGIRIDQHYRTDAPGVYACGDCAEMRGGSLKQSWTDAVQSGIAAGRAAAAYLCNTPAAETYTGISETDLMQETTKCIREEIPENTMEDFSGNPKRGLPADSMMVNAGDAHVFSAGMIPQDEDTDRIVLEWTDQVASCLVNPQPAASPATVSGENPPAAVSSGMNLTGANASGVMTSGRARGVFFFENRRLAGACVIGSLRSIRFVQSSVDRGLIKEDFLERAGERGMRG